MVSEVLIYFVADGNFVPLSVNPEMLPIEREGSNETTDIVGIGEVNLLRLPKLRTCTLESYFPAMGALGSFGGTKAYNWLKRLQETKKPLKLVVTRLNISMLMTIESLKRETRGGEHDDIYFSIELKEYKQYGIAKLQRDAQGNIVDGVSKRTDVDTLIGNNPVASLTQPLKSDDTLWAVASKYLGDGSRWLEILALNPALGDGLGTLLGVTLKLPKNVEKTL
jgi:hypothetical protein